MAAVRDPSARERAAVAGAPTTGGRRSRTRRALIGVGAVLLGALVGTTVYQVSPQPGAALVRASFEAGPLVEPPSDFRDEAALVSPVRRVRLIGSPVAHLDIYRPRAAAGSARGIVLWIHGGGFISSSSATVADYAILLAAQGFVVASLDYTIAPAAMHPTPVRQASTALTYLRAHASELGGDATRLVIGGDSAGAQIASETAAAETDPAFAGELGIAVPARAARLRGAVLFCGLYDMRTVGATGFPALRTYLWEYTNHRDWLDAPNIDQLSTTARASSAFPPTFLSVGDKDPFRSQAGELADALRSRSIPTTTLFWSGTGAGLGHEYQFDFSSPQAETALRRTVQFLQGVIGA